MLGLWAIGGSKVVIVESPKMRVEMRIIPLDEIKTTVNF
jgi:hypothetical protein